MLCKPCYQVTRDITACLWNLRYDFSYMYKYVYWMCGWCNGYWLEMRNQRDEFEFQYEFTFTLRKYAQEYHASSHIRVKQKGKLVYSYFVGSQTNEWLAANEWNRLI